jgi:hypothetical protein
MPRTRPTSTGHRHHHRQPPYFAADADPDHHRRHHPREIERDINATDAEDALKYLPSLLVRKRYIGDYNHAVLSTRASGTGNSARSMVYADGILLSNYLGNGATFAPRWGMVSPEEIERSMCCMARSRRPTAATRSARWSITSRACRPSSKRTPS